MTTPILLSHYALIIMSLCPMECRGRKNQEIKGISPDPLPPSGSQKGGGTGYARLYPPPILCVALSMINSDSCMDSMLPARSAPLALCHYHPPSRFSQFPISYTRTPGHPLPLQLTALAPGLPLKPPNFSAGPMSTTCLVSHALE